MSIQENIEISDEDAEFFNENYQDISELDSLIFQLEFEEASVYLNAFSLFSNQEIQNRAIDSFSKQLTSVCDQIKLIRSDSSPYKPILDFSNNNKELGVAFSNLELKKEELKAIDEHPNLSLGDALRYLQQIYDQPNPFNRYANIKGFRPELFCESMKIVYNHLNDRIIKYQVDNDNEYKKIKALLSDYEFQIIHVYNMRNPFYPLHSFLQYVLYNEQIFRKYFTEFTNKYYKLLLNRYFERRSLPTHNPFDADYIKNINWPDQRHFKTITILACNFLIPDLDKEEFPLSSSQRKQIIDIILENLVRIFVTNITTTTTMDYRRFNGTTFEDLQEYELSIICSRIEKDINAINVDSFIRDFQNSNKKKMLKHYITRISSLIIKKFENLKDSLKLIKDETKKYQRLIQLAIIIDSFRNECKVDIPNEYSSDIIDYVSKAAFEKGREALNDIMKDNKFLNNKVNYLYENGKADLDINEVTSKYADKLKEFQNTFVLYDKSAVITDFHRTFLYRFANGLINNFLVIWNKKIDQLCSKIEAEQKKHGTDYTIQSCCYRFIYIIYFGMGLEPLGDSNEKSIFPIDPKTGKNNFDIRILKDNWNNSDIPDAKRDCFGDLFRIIGSV